jgi:hypothetical protein
MLRKWKWQIPEEPLAAQYNWCQGPLLGRGPAVEKHWSRGLVFPAKVASSRPTEAQVLYSLSAAAGSCCRPPVLYVDTKIADCYVTAKWHALVSYGLYKTIMLHVVLYGCETWSLTLREEHRLRVFENRVSRRIFGRRRDQVSGWRKLHNEELHNLNASPSIIRIIKYPPTYLHIYSCCPQLWAWRILEMLVSLQFLNLSRKDSLDGGSARHKAASYTDTE